MINIVAAVHLHPYRRLTDSGFFAGFSGQERAAAYSVDI